MTLDVATQSGPVAVTDVMESHVNCRCTLVPRAKSYAEILGDPTLEDSRPVSETGPAIFAKLDPAIQRAVLGPGKFALYQRGLPLEAMYQRVYSAQWGVSRVARPLYAIQRMLENGTLSFAPIRVSVADAKQRWVTPGKDFAIKQAANDLLTGKLPATEPELDAQALMRALDKSGTRETVYRGLQVQSGVLTKGQYFREPLGAWTSTLGNAEGYADNPAGAAVFGKATTGNKYVLILERGKVISVPEQEEFLSGGTFEVMSTRRGDGYTYVVVRQASTFRV